MNRADNFARKLSNICPFVNFRIEKFCRCHFILIWRFIITCLLLFAFLCFAILLSLCLFFFCTLFASFNSSILAFFLVLLQLIVWHMEPHLTEDISTDRLVSTVKNCVWKNREWLTVHLLRIRVQPHFLHWLLKEQYLCTKFQSISGRLLKILALFPWVHNDPNSSLWCKSTKVRSPCFSWMADE